MPRAKNYLKKTNHELIDFGVKGSSKLKYSVLKEEVKLDSWANK